MELVFDYERYRRVIKEVAQAQNMGIVAFLADCVIDTLGIAPSEACVTMTGLHNREPEKDEEVLRHIRGCNFCTRFVKVQLLLYLDKPEMLKIFDAAYADIVSKPNPDSFFRLFSGDVPAGCLELTDLYNFNRLPRCKRDHAKTCRQCSVAIDFLRQMPLPKLTP